MKKYRVKIERVEYQYAYIDVEAENEEEAAEAAIEECPSNYFEVSGAYEDVESVEEIAEGSGE